MYIGHASKVIDGRLAKGPPSGPGVLIDPVTQGDTNLNPIKPLQFSESYDASGEAEIKHGVLSLLGVLFHQIRLCARSLADLARKMEVIKPRLSYESDDNMLPTDLLADFNQVYQSAFFSGGAVTGVTNHYNALRERIQAHLDELYTSNLMNEVSQSIEGQQIHDPPQKVKEAITNHKFERKEKNYDQ